ncbi:MAG: PKD domain-containing protein [Bacteroidia bacterium]
MKRFLLAVFFTFLYSLLLDAQNNTPYGPASSIPVGGKNKGAQSSGNFPGSKQNNVKWTAGPESMPSNLKAFQENNGQFINNINDWKVLYGCDYKGMRVLFTDHGVIYTIYEKVKIDSAETESTDNNKEKQEKKWKMVSHNVSVEWENVNTNLDVESIDRTDYKFGSLDPQHPGKSIENIDGFKKLVYHNVYPGIDVEYTFHEGKGIKYTIKVQPGYSSLSLKMFYSGQNVLMLDGQGNLHMGTPVGDIIDHAPVSSQNGKSVESSFKKINDNEIAFDVPAADNSSELTIDPWVVNPTTGGFLPSNVEMDGTNNVYIMGMDASGGTVEQKYTAAGALSWTYSYTQYGSQGYVSDLAVDLAGDSYVPMPYDATNANGDHYALISLTPAGALRYYYNTDTHPMGTIFEVWNLAYSCSYGELIQGGSPNVEQEDVAVVNSGNGTLGGVTTYTVYGEIYAGCIAPNGNYYALAANPCFGCSTPGDNIVCYTVAAGTATPTWNVQTTYQWNDFDSKNPNGISTNGIAAGCAYLYSSDGLTLDQRSLTNGAVVHTATITGGSKADPAPSGIAVDLACGNVYVGSSNSKVYVYDENLNPLTTQAVSGAVYDVTFNNGLVAACGGTAGSGFVTQFAAQTCSAMTMTHTNTTCGNSNGSATVTPTFCAAPYSYLWNPGGQTNQTATGLAAGTYTVNVGTSTSCSTASDTVTIGASTAESVTATAVNGCTGGVNTTVTGGVAPYTYSWNTGQTTSSITGVASGGYTVTVTDSKGCVETANATVSGVTLTVTPSQTDDACFGGSTGSISLAASGGSTPYTYTWSSGQSTSSISGLTAGVYSYTVMEAGGCTNNGSITITQPTAVAPTATPTAALCNGGNGSITTSITGGTQAYTYVWSSGQTTSSITGPAGPYTVTVTDAHGCTGTATATITQPTALAPTATATPAVCNGGDGSITTAGTSGGTPAYTYSWNSGQTTSTITAAAGSYTVTVTDANGCVQIANATINQPTVLVPVAVATPALCNGADGSITTAGTAGGTPAYTYSWNSGQTTSSINDIAGTYTVTVTDANGCKQTANATINQPTALVPVAVATDALCNGDNGSITTTGTTGGTPAYTYLWNNGLITSNITAAAGSYTVTVTDANGCKQTANATITQPAVLVPVAVPAAALCYGGNGSITTTGTAGGTPAYTYSWNSGQTTSSITVPVGSYTVTVTDANGCTANASATITQPPQLRDSITSVTNVLCFGNSTGSLGAGVKGGTPGYKYSWAPAGATNNPAANIPAGSYTLTVTDANGCTVTADTVITQPTKLTIIAEASPATCNGLCNGQLLTIPTGGTPGYNYSWSNGSTTTSQLNMCAGTYSVVVTDANGCNADTNGLLVTQPAPITGAIATPATAYCNQADGGACVAGATGGTPVYTYLWSNGITATCITNVTPGIYSVIISDTHNCTDTVLVTVPDVPGETASITATTDVTCFGGNNGSATAGGVNGTPPYTYLWKTGGQTTQTATGLSAGIYTVTLTDKEGCIDSAIATITQPALVVATPGPPKTICIGQSATISVSDSGGTSPYNYIWSPDSALSATTGSTVTASPTKTTIYTVTTTDVNNCPGAPVTITVTVNPPLSVIVTPDRATCPGGSVSFTATASGGDGTYNYNWKPGGLTGSTITVSPAVTTEYTVTVTDGCGTPAVHDSVKAIIDPLPVVKFSADTLSGCWPLCVKFTDLTTISSDSLVSWAWTFGDGSASDNRDTEHCFNNTGIYSIGLTVKSDSNCVDSLTIHNMITVYSHPVAKFTAAPQPTTIIDPTIYFTDESTDAYGIKSWYWQFRDELDGTSTAENPVYTFSDTGTFCPLLIVTNIHECTDSAEECIYIAPYYTLYIPNAFTPNGDGVNDVFAPKGQFVCNFEMYIFDRWGMQMYYTTDMNEGWNGKVTGGANVAQEDTYVYLINVVDCLTKSKHQFIGKVTLIK